LSVCCHTLYLHAEQNSKRWEYSALCTLTLLLPTTNRLQMNVRIYHEIQKKKLKDNHKCFSKTICHTVKNRSRKLSILIKMRDYEVIKTAFSLSGPPNM